MPGRDVETCREVRCAIVAKIHEHVPMVGKIGVLFEMLPEIRTDVRKEHVVDERDRRRRAFDVQQDCPDTTERHSRHIPMTGLAGRYDGPKQSGWKPLSMPVSV